MKIRLYMTAVTEVLGPGKRFAIWVQGCNRHCKGCIAPDTWDLDGGYEIYVEELAKEILNTPDIEGITISGGEPFLQQDALCALICLIKEYKDMGVIVYTGMMYEKIKDTLLANNTDIIIDGEYVEELNDNKSLRGSSNQNIVCLTDRYKESAGAHYGRQGRKIEMQIKGNKMTMVGIPPKL